MISIGVETHLIGREHDALHGRVSERLRQYVFQTFGKLPKGLIGALETESGFQL